MLYGNDKVDMHVSEASLLNLTEWRPVSDLHHDEKLATHFFAQHDVCGISLAKVGVPQICG